MGRQATRPTEGRSVRVERVLFVCTGNICRSPLAEGIFRDRAERRGVAGRFVVDSAGTSAWTAGRPPDPRTLQVAERHGLRLARVARPLAPDDVRRFDHLVGMDEGHREDLLAMGASPQRVSLLLEFHPAAPRLEVPDPFRGAPEDFEVVYGLIEPACAALLERLLSSGPVVG
jgi:protein-tyrosine phosphatase